MPDDTRPKPASGIKIDTGCELHHVLRLYSGRHICFFPNYGNCGDGFIACATYKVFEAYNIGFTTHRQDEIVHDSVVFIGGGGNLIEGLYDHSAKIIMAHCRDNEIVLLPHTIVGNADVLRETHGHLKIFCRETASYEMALAGAGNKANIHLAHDMTFYLGRDHFDEFRTEGSGLLSALRTDGESKGDIAVPDGNIDISRSWDGDIWGSPLFAEYATKSLFAFVSQFEAVLTDRLHVSIIGSLLKKRVVFVPNSYFKNDAVYAHSMRDRFPLTQMGETPRNQALMASFGMTLSAASGDHRGSTPRADNKPDQSLRAGTRWRGGRGFKAMLAKVLAR